MEVVIAPLEELATVAADAVMAALARRADPVVGLATGSSPLAIYDELFRRHRAGRSFAHVRAFLLDEYVGLPREHSQSYHAVIRRELLERLDVPDGAVAGLDGLAQDLHAECVGYERATAAAGGVDVQILGLGSDGHIAFNEPGSSLTSRTRVKTLNARTRGDNARFFGGNVDQVPQHVLTQGLGTIMDARRLVLIATGEHKAEAASRIIEGPVSAMWPGSVLQLHPEVLVLLDDGAASQLQLANYYRGTWEAKALLPAASRLSG